MAESRGVALPEVFEEVVENLLGLVLGGEELEHVMGAFVRYGAAENHPSSTTMSVPVI
jgi:hypothetical protein